MIFIYYIFLVRSDDNAVSQLFFYNNTVISNDKINLIVFTSFSVVLGRKRKSRWNKMRPFVESLPKLIKFTIINFLHDVKSCTSNYKY